MTIQLVEECFAKTRNELIYKIIKSDRGDRFCYPYMSSDRQHAWTTIGKYWTYKDSPEDLVCLLDPTPIVGEVWQSRGDDDVTAKVVYIETEFVCWKLFFKNKFVSIRSDTIVKFTSYFLPFKQKPLECFITVYENSPSLFGSAYRYVDQAESVVLKNGGSGRVAKFREVVE